MNDPREVSHPPSAPPSVRRGTLVPDDRPLRVRVVAAWLLGLVLVALGLYVWHRPGGRTEAAEPADSAAASASAAAIPVSSAEAGAPSPILVSDGRVVGCHDRGPRKTPPAECDHLPTVEKALATAIERSAACVPSGGVGDSSSVAVGTIEYVVDVSFSRGKVSLFMPRAGRSVNDRKVLGACASAVRAALRPLALEGIDHQHARYQIAMTASYRGSSHGT